VRTAVDSLRCEVALFNLDQTIHFLLAERADRRKVVLFSFHADASLESSVRLTVWFTATGLYAGRAKARVATGPVVGCKRVL